MTTDRLGFGVAGVVLAGGRSSRMGRTKALVEIDGRPMADRVLDALHAGGCSPLVIAGGDPDELAPLSVPVWPDDRPGDGPVAGIASALRRLADDDTFGGDLAVIVSCDLPWLGPEVVERLVVGLVRSPAADVCVARTDRREPLCAAWRTRLADRVAAELDRDVRAVHALLDRLRTVEVDVDPARVVNVNTPDDVADAERARRGVGPVEQPRQ